MDTSGNRAVDLRDSGFINVRGRRIQVNDDSRTSRVTNLDDGIRTPRRTYLDDDIRALRSMRLELDNAKKELKETCAKLKRSQLQVKHLSKENDQLKLDLQLCNEDKEIEKIQMRAENDKIQEALFAKDMNLEDSRNQIKLLNKLLKEYEMALRKTKEKNPHIQSNIEYNELSRHLIDSNEEVEQMNIIVEELAENIVHMKQNIEHMAVASEATNNKLETMGAQMTNMEAIVTNMNAMLTHLMTKSKALDDGRADKLP